MFLQSLKFSIFIISKFLLAPFPFLLTLLNSHISKMHQVLNELLYSSLWRQSSNKIKVSAMYTSLTIDTFKNYIYRHQKYNFINGYQKFSKAKKRYLLCVCFFSASVKIAYYDFSHLLSICKFYIMLKKTEM